MLLDRQAQFSNRQAITASAASTDYINLQPKGKRPHSGGGVWTDIGIGNAVPLLVQVTDNFTGGTSVAAIASWTDSMKITAEEGLDGAIPEGSLTKGVESAAEGLTEAPLTQWCASAFDVFANWSTNVSTVISEAMEVAKASINDMILTSQGLGQISLSNDLRTGINREITTGGAVTAEELEYIYTKATDAAVTKVISVLGPMIVSGNSDTENSGTGDILQIGTLIASNDGLRELERKLQIIRDQEGRT